MAAGRESFARRGLRGTSVEELARAAAISKGAFYRFFDSKEVLLLALLAEYEEQVHARLEAAVRADPTRGVALLVEECVHAADRDPLLPVLMSEEGMRVLASLPPAERQELMDRDVRLVRRVMDILQEVGAAPPVPERVLLGLLRSLFFAGMHRAEIGADLLAETAEWLTDVLGGQRP
jgi:AcrR family transcriptional regulator